MLYVLRRAYCKNILGHWGVGIIQWTLKPCWKSFGRPPQHVVALLAIFVGDGLGFFVDTRLVPCSVPGVRIRTFMKCGCAFAQESAFRLVSKKRSITIALRSAAVRPQERAALRRTTAGPVSTATHVASGKTTLLP